MFGILKREASASKPAGKVLASDVANSHELDEQIARRQSWIEDLNTLMQELEVAITTVDHYRGALLRESSDPELIGNSSFEEMQQSRVELKRQLHHALQNQNRIEQQIEAHENRYGSRDAIQTELGTLYAHKLELQRQKDADILQGLDKDTIRLLEAAQQAQRDRNKLAEEYFRKYAREVKAVITPGAFEPEYGKGESCVWINGIKYLAGRAWGPDILAVDDPVRQHVSEVPSINSITFTSYGGGK